MRVEGEDGFGVGEGLDAEEDLEVFIGYGRGGSGAILASALCRQHLAHDVKD